MAGNAENLEKSDNEKVTMLAIRKYCLEVKLTSIELFSLWSQMTAIYNVVRHVWTALQYSKSRLDHDQIKFHSCNVNSNSNADHFVADDARRLSKHGTYLEKTLTVT